MPRDINEHQVQELLDQGLSERAIAQQLNIPRTTLKRHLAKRGTQNVHQSVPNTHELPTTPGTQEVYQGIPLAAELVASQDDLIEIVAWWRERKQLTQTPADPERETERKTYHVEKRHIAAIERAADLERVSITEIVNRALQQYFAGR